MHFQDLSKDLQKKFRNAYHAQKSRAKQRGIGWLLDFEDWCAFWLRDSRYLCRVRGKHKLVMCRHGDTGPYHPANIYCASSQANSRLSGINQRFRSGPHWTKATGTKPQREPRPVATPAGTFESLSSAARHHDLARSSVHYLLNASTSPSWHYL